MPPTLASVQLLPEHLQLEPTGTQQPVPAKTALQAARTAMDQGLETVTLVP